MRPDPPGEKLRTRCPGWVTEGSQLSLPSPTVRRPERAPLRRLYPGLRPRLPSAADVSVHSSGQSEPPQAANESQASSGVLDPQNGRENIAGRTSLQPPHASTAINSPGAGHSPGAWAPVPDQRSSWLSGSEGHWPSDSADFNGPSWHNAFSGVTLANNSVTCSTRADFAGAGSTLGRAAHSSHGPAQQTQLVGPASPPNMNPAGPGWRFPQSEASLAGGRPIEPDGNPYSARSTLARFRDAKFMLPSTRDD